MHFFLHSLFPLQMYYDDLPLWGFLGKVEKTPTPRFFLYTHMHFDIGWNGDNVIGLNVSANPKWVVDISEDTPIEIEFSYSAKWVPTEITFDHRLDKYERVSVMPQHLEVRELNIFFQSRLKHCWSAPFA